MKKAIVIGATGMVGTELIKLLIQNETYTEIVSLVRRPSGVTHPKLTERIIDFNHPETWSMFMKGDVLFSTLGTTLSKSKSKDAQYKVDFTYQFTAAKTAAENGVAHYVLISSAGANSKSLTFYMRMKGKLEDAIQTLPFKVISILRPGQLAGKRSEIRLGEKTGLAVMLGLNKLGFFKRYRPIYGHQAAQAMIRAAEKANSATYTLDEVFELIH